MAIVSDQPLETATGAFGFLQFIASILKLLGCFLPDGICAD